MPKCSLHEVDWGPAVQRVAGMSVPKPVGRDIAGDARSPSCSPDNPQDLRRIQVAAAIPRGKDRLVDAGAPPQADKLLPDAGRQENHLGLIARAVAVDLYALFPLLQGYWELQDELESSCERNEAFCSVAASLGHCERPVDGSAGS